MSQFPGHREGEKTLPARESPRALYERKDYGADGKLKCVKQAADSRYAQRYKSNKQNGYVLVPNDAMCEVRNKATISISTQRNK